MCRSLLLRHKNFITRLRRTVAPHDRRRFAGDFDRRSSLTLLTWLTGPATTTLLMATTTAPASTAATTTIAVAIPSLLTGALLIARTSIQFLSPGAMKRGRPVLHRLPQP
jgi:uncharacterized membrane protein YdcZ (DUF606 family)